MKFRNGFEKTERKLTHLTPKGVKVLFVRKKDNTFLENCHFIVRQIISEK